MKRYRLSSILTAIVDGDTFRDDLARARARKALGRSRSETHHDFASARKIHDLLVAEAKRLGVEMEDC